MLDIVICMLSNLFRVYLIDRFAAAFYRENRYDGKIRVLVCGLSYAANTMLFLGFHLVWVNLISNLVGTMVIVWLHTGSPGSDLFMSFFLCAVGIGCDTIATMPFVQYQDGKMHNQFCAALSVLLFYICILLMERMSDKKHKKGQVRKLSLILVPIFSILPFLILYYTDACTEFGFSVLSIDVLLINFLILYLYNVLQRSLEKSYEAELLRQKADIYSHQLDVILQNEEKVKAFRHDMKHHLCELRLLNHQRDPEGVQEYLDKMDGFLENPAEIVASGNREVDSVLNYILGKAKEELNDVRVKIVLPQALEHSFVMNVILANLLENALEAAKQTTEKRLNVEIGCGEGLLKVRIENSFLPEKIKRADGKGQLLTTKKDKERHGIGLQNVERMVEQYHGALQITTENDLFCVDLILYLSELEKKEEKL